MRQRLKLGEMLVNAGLISKDQLERALQEQKRAGLKLGEYLIRHNLVQESQIIDLISQQLNIEKYHPDKFPLDMNLANLISSDIAQKFKLVPLALQGSLLTVAMVDPMDISALDQIEIETNKEVEPVICSEQDLNNLIGALYGMYSGLSNVVEGLSGVEFESREASDWSAPETDLQVSSLQDMAEDAPVIRLVNSILSQAIRENASDVHISPEKDSVQVRFRIDGHLQETPAPPKSMFLPIVSRLKILANMDIATSRIPQDGRFTIKMGGREINVRASAVPTIHGENMVLRLLDMSSGGKTLDQLGMPAREQEKIKEVLNKPYGMILSSGPTGSGKSTTLYAILHELNTPDVNIITLEDPVEYRIEKIRQVHLNRRAGMTFASGLRSVLRQDPDVIMVGEIRDQETAQIAVQAALTGHRLLSTMHTNDAAGTINRLMDMGIESFLVSSVLLACIAQRLVRKVCDYCKEPYTPDPSYLRYWGLENVQKSNYQKGRGCYHCNNTGYRGRTGIFEILVNDQSIQEMIHKHASSQEIIKNAHQAGKLRTLKENARLKIVQGITTFEEATAAVMA